jgi:FkbM family methyltransferase
MSGSGMFKTATNIIKGVLRGRKRVKHNFSQISWAQEKILKHQEDRLTKQLQLGKLTLYYKRPYELLHSYREIFEEEIYRFESYKKEPVIFDCGSNIGLSVLYFKQLYPQARVIAFEPDPNNFQLLQQNAEKNKLSNLELHQAAVWTRDGSISFAANESEASHITETADGNQVSARDLKALLALEQEVDFLKMDIEGAEGEVIPHIRAQLPKIRHLFLEYHGKVEETEKLNRLLQLLQEAGFQVYIRNAADNLRHPFVEKRTHTIYDVQLNLFCYK